MEAISKRQNSDHRSSKQDDFSEDEGDTVIASALTAALHEKSTTTESPVANTENRIKGDTMSSEMADPGSPPLVPTTPHVPADAPSPRYMRKRATWSGRVLRSEYLWAWRAGK